MKLAYNAEAKFETFLGGNLMDNFDANLNEVFDEAFDSLDYDEIEKKLAVRERMARVREAEARAKAAEQEAELKHREVVEHGAINFKKDILPILPGMATACIAAIPAVLTLKAANVKASTDLAISNNTNNARLQALGFWKKRQEEDLIDDKALKATNELFR